jgi:methylthioribulose-1-phosphate dehydratase
MLYTENESHVSDQDQASNFFEVATRLSQLGREFYGRGWVLGTGGNFSAVLSRAPLRLAITSSGVDKSTLAAEHILLIDAEGRLLTGAGRPSAETLLHLIVLRAREEAGAVLHTHSVWATALSEVCAGDGGVSISGYEMLKGLAGVETHEHREWLPIIENSQRWGESRPSVEELLGRHPGAHGFLIRGHGLYTWGRDLTEAKRHVEIFEFLLEALGRTRSLLTPGLWPRPGGVE